MKLRSDHSVAVPSLGAFALLAAIALPLVACGGAESAGTTPHDGGGAEDAPSFGGDCGVVELVPPVITVQLASPSGAGCAVTFATVDGTTGAAGTPIDAALCGVGAMEPDGCPDAPSDAASGDCIYVLAGYEGTHTVQVSQSGYVSVLIDGVSAGQGGECFAPVASTHAAVTLQQVELTVGGAH